MMAGLGILDVFVILRGCFLLGVVVTRLGMLGAAIPGRSGDDLLEKEH